jgi:hypothetical protein
MAVLCVGLVIAGCGGGEPPPASKPTAPIATTAAPKAATQADRVPVGCVVKWTSGATGTFSCTAGGPNGGKVKVDKDTFRLDRICVNDPRITTYGFSGQTAPIGATGTGALRCAEFNGVKQLPETCSCVPPAGGDCTPPKDGFACLAAGHVPLDGG